MEDTISDFEGRIEQLMDIMDEKLDRTAIESMISDKIGKEEVQELLPNMETYDNKVQSMIEENSDLLWTRIEEKLMGWDTRML